MHKKSPSSKLRYSPEKNLVPLYTIVLACSISFKKSILGENNLDGNPTGMTNQSLQKLIYFLSNFQQIYRRANSELKKTLKNEIENTHRQCEN